MILFLVFEYKMHFFQHKILLVLMLNSFLIFSSCQLNPAYSMAILWVTLNPIMKRYEQAIEAEIEKAFKHDIHLDLYEYKSKAKIQQESEHGAAELPGSESRLTAKKPGILGNLLSFRETQVYQFLKSIVFMCILIKVRDPLTPNIFHFLTCLVDEEVHFLFIMLLWSIFKCFFTPNSHEVSLLSADQRQTKRLQTVVRALLELVIALTIMRDSVSFYGWVCSLSLFGFVCLRALFSEALDLITVFFVITYFF